MEQTTLTNAEQEYWELLYNHKQICEALVQEGAAVAKALFRSKLRRITQLGARGDTEEAAFILLTSLNRGLYNHLLTQLDLSFTECCFRNRAHNHRFTDAPTLDQAGERIIDAYAACLEKSRANRPQIERACAYINEHLGEDLSLGRVSQAVYLSKSQLCAMFKALMGSTFNDYVRQRRLRLARSLLTATDRSIDDIADACGFNSSTYFATVFKGELGMSPSAFRQSFGGRKGKAE